MTSATMTMPYQNMYTITGSPNLSGGLSLHKSAPHALQRDHTLSQNGLRILYRGSISPPSPATPRPHSDVTAGENITPAMPLTPPRIESERTHEVDSVAMTLEENMTRSLLVTPVNQQSPPTPDLTPPRPPYSLNHPSLGTQKSMASTRAESFRTAREELTSEAGSMTSLPQYNHYGAGIQSPNEGMGLDHTTEQRTLLVKSSMPSKAVYRQLLPTAAPVNNTGIPRKLRADLSDYEETTGDHPFEDSPTLPQGLFRLPTSPHQPSQLKPLLDSLTPGHMAFADQSQQKSSLTNLYGMFGTHAVSNHASPKRIASIIGWDDGIHRRSHDGKRLSDVSATSTIEAVVVEKGRLGRGKGTLRHVSKNDSLRSASLPLSVPESIKPWEVSGSPHRLHHMTARLSNANRNSFGSEISPSSKLSMNMPRSKLEVIKVAVIPDRISSLSVADSGSRRSRSNSAESGSESVIRIASSLSSTGRRRISDSSNKEKTRYYPPQVPPFVPVRRSSVSAPTSQSASYAGSVTSDGLELERRRAEKDLRSTLERMESERTSGDLQPPSSQSDGSEAGNLDSQHLRERHSGRRNSTEYHHMATLPHNFYHCGHSVNEPKSRADSTSDPQPVDPIRAVLHSHAIVPGSREWAALRPTSTLETPFSQPSVLSSSPEINEAKAINLFPHNNYSVQLIEPYQPQDSWNSRHMYMSGNEMHKVVPERYVESPLRNPRPPPQPPYTWSNSTQVMRADERKNDDLGEMSAVKRSFNHRRPSLGNQERTDSLGRSLIKIVSLKNTRNKKAEQDLDPKLNPFWRPRAFWDDTEQRPSHHGDGNREIVQNSLGLPAQTHQAMGRVGLMHRISERRRRKVTIAKQTSFTSLRMIKSGRRFHNVPAFGLNFRLINVKDVRNRFADGRQKRRHEQWEKKHAELRKSIGLPLMSVVDSRFPAEANEDM